MRDVERAEKSKRHYGGSVQDQSLHQPFAKRVFLPDEP